MEAAPSAAPCGSAVLRRRTRAGWLTIVKSWLGDLLRMVWALGYWNARKTMFVLRQRRGACPCFNPSDSGRPRETGCEAVLHWAQPARFRRVCPLLVRNERGGWVCSVAADGVRPFWGRAWGYAGGAVAAVALAAGAGAWGTMRAIGYQVSLRQVFWPPAWRELREVRAQLFVRQAQDHFRAGRMREAVTALMTAHQVAPADYAVAMTLAQVMQGANPAAADALFLQMMQQHPDRRNDTARVWFTGLLGRGQLADVGELARRQLAADPANAGVWTHALIFAARRLQNPRMLEEAAGAAGTPAAAAGVLRFEARVRRAQPAAVPDLLLREPLSKDFPYAFIQRAELFIEFGRPREALGVLAVSQDFVGKLDLVRLGLAAMAAGGERERLAREAGTLLNQPKNPVALTVILLGEHLIRYPDKALLAQVATRWEGAVGVAPENKMEAWYALLCAAGAAGDRGTFDRLGAGAVAQEAVTRAALARLQEFFFGPPDQRRLDAIMPPAGLVSLELPYALLDRYWKPGEKL